MKSRFSLCCGALALTACSLTPEYQAPQINAPQQWQQAAPATQDVHINADWWKQFNDEVLTQLVEESLRSNRDLAIAAARILQAQAQAGISASALAPQISANTGAQTGTLATGDTSRYNAVSATGNISFELDLWGKLRSANDADRARVLSSEFSRQALQLSLTAQVATAYFQLRMLDKQSEIAKINLQAQEDSLRLTQRRFEGGLASEADFAQAKAQVDSTRASIPELQRQSAILQNQISILLGRNPGDIPRGKLIGELALLGVVPGGLPSQLLTHRPDILAAEYQLRASNADIGAARAAFLPSISLSAMAGAESGQLSSLTRGGSGIWSAGFGLTQPIFNAGRLSNQLEAAKAAQQEQVLTYQKTVQIAFREVEDGLVNVRLFRAQVNDKRSRVDNLKTAHKIAGLRYKEGLTSFLDVLDAQRSQLQAELDLAAIEFQQLSALVELYKALGGGWESRKSNPTS
jgi:outer membrane protein, multidrug efflux system